MTSTAENNLLTILKKMGEPTNSYNMNEKKKPKMSLRQRCIANHAMTFDEFKAEFLKRLNAALIKNGIH